MNKCILVGRLTNDLNLKESESGTKNLSFNIAVNRNFKNANGEYEADFISCKAFNKTAELIANHFEKGNRIGVIGSIQTSNYEKDGQIVYRTDVMVNEVEFIESKKKSDDTPSPYDTAKKDEPSDPFGDFGNSIDITDTFLD